jgi:hypothetical protein
MEILVVLWKNWNPVGASATRLSAQPDIVDAERMD